MEEIEDAYDEGETKSYLTVVENSLIHKGFAFPSVLECFGEISGKTVVDFGCGGGELLRICGRLGAGRLVGYDGSSWMLEEAQKLDKVEFGQNIIQYHRVDCFKPILNIQKEQFDLASSTFLIPYCNSVEKLQQFCSSVFSCLKPGGRFCLATIPFFLDDIRQQHIIETCFGVRYPIRPDSVTDPIQFPVVVIKPNGDVLFQLKNIHWHRDTIEKCLLKAGFNRVEDCPPRLKIPALEKELAEKWSQFLDNTSFILLVAQK